MLIPKTNLFIAATSDGRRCLLTSVEQMKRKCLSFNNCPILAVGADFRGIGISYEFFFSTKPNQELSSLDMVQR